MADEFIQFRQGQPFFDMVGSFLIAIAGSPAIINPDNPMKLEEGHYISIFGILTPGRSIRPREIHDQFAKGHLSQSQFLLTCCAMLTNTAYEAVKKSRDRSPEFEFFRHVRNASSHGNRFNFSPIEPSRPAAWRSATINHTLKGSANPLYGTECFGTIIDAADIIELLWDIQQKIAI